MYRSIQITGRLLGRLFWRVRLQGREHVPVTGPLLVAVTHESVLDPVIVGSYMPRIIRYLARNTLFGSQGEIAFRGRVLKWLGAVPIEREGGGARATMRITEQLLASGEAVLIFPEGTRSRDGGVQPFRRGAGMIARHTGCPVLPVSIDGSHGLWPKGRKLPRIFGGPVHLRIGAPVTYEKTNNVEEIVADLRARVLQLRGQPAGDGAGGREATGDGPS